MEANTWKTSFVHFLSIFLQAGTVHFAYGRLRKDRQQLSNLKL